jgi:hypothetical protein
MPTSLVTPSPNRSVEAATCHVNTVTMSGERVRTSKAYSFSGGAAA